MQDSDCLERMLPAEEVSQGKKRCGYAAEASESTSSLSVCTKELLAAEARLCLSSISHQRISDEANDWQDEGSSRVCPGCIPRAEGEKALHDDETVCEDTGGNMEGNSSGKEGTRALGLDENFCCFDSKPLERASGSAANS